jgi:hypothetical protein
MIGLIGTAALTYFFGFSKKDLEVRSNEGVL